MKKAFGIEAQLIEGRGGIFDVKVDGGLIFSKHLVGRFPQPGEVVGLIGKRTK